MKNLCLVLLIGLKKAFIDIILMKNLCSVFIYLNTMALIL